MSDLLNGKKEPSVDELRTLREALDCTGDFLLDPPAPAAADERDRVSHMAYDVFARDLAESDEQRARCRRVLGHRASPIKALDWKDLAEMIDRAFGPPAEPPNLQIIQGGRSE
jgi:hypothetical protein